MLTPLACRFKIITILLFQVGFLDYDESYPHAVIRAMIRYHISDSWVDTSRSMSTKTWTDILHINTGPLKLTFGVQPWTKAPSHSIAIYQRIFS